MKISDLINKGATNLDLSNILASKKTELTRLKGVKITRLLSLDQLKNWKLR